jgi:hypothetical protein
MHFNPEFDAMLINRFKIAVASQKFLELKCPGEPDKFTHKFCCPIIVLKPPVKRSNNFEVIGIRANFAK